MDYLKKFGFIILPALLAVYAEAEPIILKPADNCRKSGETEIRVSPEYTWLLWGDISWQYLDLPVGFSYGVTDWLEVSAGAVCSARQRDASGDLSQYYLNEKSWGSGPVSAGIKLNFLDDTPDTPEMAVGVEAEFSFTKTAELKLGQGINVGAFFAMSKYIDPVTIYLNAGYKYTGPYDHHYNVVNAWLWGFVDGTIPVRVNPGDILSYGIGMELVLGDFTLLAEVETFSSQNMCVDGVTLDRSEGDSLYCYPGLIYHFGKWKLRLGAGFSVYDTFPFESWYRYDYQWKIISGISYDL